MKPSNLDTFFQKELPLINQALNEAISALPASCKKIANHIINAGGKRLRPALVILFGRMYGYAHKNIYTLATSMELLHAATLLHDDILDSADKRRGKACAHKIFGNVQSILTGDAMLALGNAIVSNFNKPELCSCFSHATMQTAIGEIQEMDLLYDPLISEEDYLAMITGKTASLIADSCCLGCLVAHHDRQIVNDVHEFGINLGIAFQIIDDVLDFLPDNKTGKPLGGDLKEGKLTPPIRFYRDSLDDNEKRQFDEKFISAIYSQTSVESLILKIIPFAEKTRNYALGFLENARKNLSVFPDCPEKKLLEEILNQAEKRTY